MTSREEIDAFRSELLRRFDELTHWAVDNWPDRQRPLTAVDFAPMREHFARAGEPPEHLRQEEPPPDPAAGGPQFRDVDPAPWP
ncbi:hypothetical protein SAMN06265795_107107 [Noviherbaspirillum humi]|uniref:Uncharacterized protein n=1 Tax=Noviherbaspirillum humi TaxID=1688639 RepID=A0A239HPX4_9BURK|nr:hypothetical protein [Noviherbaspirillum humi]SNS83399.1 hypothetical protein SAMN06265795_107107 [Noviherbaspirillum humi]